MRKKLTELPGELLRYEEDEKEKLNEEEKGHIVRVSIMQIMGEPGRGENCVFFTHFQRRLR